LEAIGWHHAEPILRSLVYGLLDRDGTKEDPAKADLPADRPYRQNVERVKEVRANWLEGKPNADATREMLVTIREGSAKDAGEKARESLNGGGAPQRIFRASAAAAG